MHENECKSQNKKEGKFPSKWRRVQDSNLCTVIHGDGLAIRRITTLIDCILTKNLFILTFQ